MWSIINLAQRREAECCGIVAKSWYFLRLCNADDKILRIADYFYFLLLPPYAVYIRITFVLPSATFVKINVIFYLVSHVNTF